MESPSVHEVAHPAPPRRAAPGRSGDWRQASADCLETTSSGRVWIFHWFPRLCWPLPMRAATKTLFAPQIRVACQRCQLFTPTMWCIIEFASVCYLSILWASRKVGGEGWNPGSGKERHYCRRGSPFNGVLRQGYVFLWIDKGGVAPKWRIKYSTNQNK